MASLAVLQDGQLFLHLPLQNSNKQQVTAQSAHLYRRCSTTLVECLRIPVPPPSDLRLYCDIKQADGERARKDGLPGDVGLVWTKLALGLSSKETMQAQAHFFCHPFNRRLST